MVYYGLPQRNTKPTVLVYCEGLEDAAFLKYLKHLYHQDHIDPRVRIQSDRGGTADGIVLDALNVYGDYSYRVVVLDNDKKLEEMQKAQKLALANNIILVLSTPCMERLLLEVMNHSDLNPKLGSNKCKKLFEDSYFVGLDRTDWGDYGRIFLKKSLNARMSQLVGLKRMHNLVRGDMEHVSSDVIGVTTL